MPGQYRVTLQVCVLNIRPNLVTAVSAYVLAPSCTRPPAFRLNSKPDNTYIFSSMILKICWSGGWFSIKMQCCQYTNSHYGDKTILPPSYLHNGNFYAGKMTPLYWIRAPDGTIQKSWWDPTRSTTIEVLKSNSNFACGPCNLPGLTKLVMGITQCNNTHISEAQITPTEIVWTKTIVFNLCVCNCFEEI